MSKCQCRASGQEETKIKSATRDSKDKNAWRVEVEDQNGNSSTITVLSMGSFPSIEKARKTLL